MINFRSALAGLARIGSRLDLTAIAAMIAVGWGTQHLNKVMGDRVEQLMQIDTRHELAKAAAIEWEGRRDQAWQAVQELQESATKSAPDVVPENAKRPGQRPFRDAPATSSSVIGRGDAPAED